MTKPRKDKAPRYTAGPSLGGWAFTDDEVARMNATMAAAAKMMAEKAKRPEPLIRILRRKPATPEQAQ